MKALIVVGLLALGGCAERQQLRPDKVDQTATSDNSDYGAGKKVEWERP